jgi:hypothetical protein
MEEISNTATRGPAKGYVEALEHRLQVTESVLLRLLSRVSGPELSTIFPEDSLLSDGTDYAPLARLEKKGVKEWSQFPLDTAHNIRKWQRVCTGQGSDGSDGQAVEPECFSPVHHGVKRSMENHEQEQSASPIAFGKTSGRHSLSGPGHRATFAERGSETPNHSDRGASVSYGQDTHTIQARSSWDGAPSISFQQQFLW